MQRIDSATKAVDLHGPGKDGFRDGDRASLTPATDFTAKWCNTLQEEIANVIESRGVELDPDSNTQLLDAIVDIVSDFVASYGGFVKANQANAFTSGNYCEEKALPATTGSVTLDLDAGVNFGGQLTGSIVMANPSHMHAGQSGVIRIVNDAATPRTIAWGAYWKTPGGIMPGLTASAGATDVFGYYVESASRITVIKQEDLK